MVQYIVGVPGSGKTYKAMFSLYANFGLNKEKIKNLNNYKFKNVDFALTNINEIKLDNFEDEKVLKLDYDNFKENLTILHSMYKNKCNDTQLIEKAKELKLFKVLIILDECHNFLDNQNAVLVWWLSYHRHLHQEIYLITQNLALVNSKYKAFSEFFYRARPSSMKLFRKNMIYSQFIDSRMAAKSKSATLKVPLLNDVFSSYGSGANHQSENILRKYLLISFLLLVLMIFLFSFISSYWSGQVKPDEEKIINSKIVNHYEKQIKEKKKIKTSNKISNDNNFLIILNCVKNIGCDYNQQFYPYSYIHNFIVSTKSNLKDTYRLGIYDGDIIEDLYILTTYDKVNSFFLKSKPINKRKSNITIF